MNENELIEEVSSMPESTKQALAEKAKESLFFMSHGLLGMKDVNLHTHGAFCRFIQSETKLRRIGLMPRLHLKTAIATESDTIRLMVKDPNHARILIVGETDKTAGDIMGAIKQVFEKNQLIRMLYQEIVPPRLSGPGIQWSSEGLNMVRSTSYKEPTLMSVGVGGAVVSKHFTRIKADDLIGFEASRSPSVMKSTIKWNDSIEGLIVSAHETIIDWIGTRWAKNDLYSHLIEQYGSMMAVFRRGLIENNNLIFPEKFNWDQVALLKKKPDEFSAQYENDPKSSVSMDFDSGDVRYYKMDSEGNLCYDIGGKVSKWHRESLDRVITVDPNSGSLTAPDEASIIVSGVAPDGRKFVLEEWGGRVRPDDLVDKIYSLASKWRPRVVGIEQAATQNTMFYFRKKCKDTGIYFNVEPLLHKNRVKEERIRTALQPVIASNMLYLLPSQRELFKQIEDFPSVKNDDRIDALAYAQELWRTPMKVEEEEKVNGAVNKLMASRNIMTGY